MSVYTLLNQNQLEALLAQYGLAHLESFAEIADGIENSNYLLKADGKEFVLTIFERAASANFLPYLSFMAAAQAQGKAVPCPLLNLEGERLSSFTFESASKRFILCERLRGSHPKEISLALCEHLGEEIAGIHSLKFLDDVLAQFPFRGFSDFILDLNFETLLNAEKLRVFQKELAFIEALKQEASVLPTGIGHCDFFPDNALSVFENGKERISAFLDWYDARNTYLILDLAIIAVSWCTKDFKLLEDKEAALLKGYQKIRPFTHAEQKLWRGFLRVAALSFWISREDYHAQMHLQGRAKAINPKKSTEEFYCLLLNLK